MLNKPLNSEWKVLNALEIVIGSTTGIRVVVQ